MVQDCMNPAWLEPLLVRLRAEPAADGFLIAPPRSALATALRRQLPRIRWMRRAPGDLRITDPRRQLAVVLQSLEVLDRATASILLADLRDRLAAHSLIWVDLARSSLPEVELRALGFRLLARDADQALFGFDLYDYKDRPEWLSPQHWAHPERWDKHRW